MLIWMELHFNPSAFAVTIREASYDNAKHYDLVDSDLVVYNFDRVKEYVCRKLRDNSLTRSCDAYYVDQNGREYLIEFKNQREADVPRNSLKQKAYDSVYLLLLTFDKEKSIQETAQNLTLMIIYNDRAAVGSREYQYSESESFDKLARKFGSLAKMDHPREIRFGLSYLQGQLFREVYTLDVREFMQRFVRRWAEEAACSEVDY